MNWCCLFCHGACPYSAKLPRIGGCFKSKSYAETKKAATDLVTTCSPLPLMLLQADSTGEGHPQIFFARLEKKLPLVIPVDMSKCHWHELNINSMKVYIWGCALSLPCLAVSQAHSWITSCVSTLKHCQARSLSAAIPLSPCCYFSLFSLFHTSGV